MIDPDYEFYNFRGEPNLESRDYTATIEIRDGWGRLVAEVGDWVDFSFVNSSEVNDFEASSFQIPGTSPWTKFVMRANRMIVLAHIVLRRDGRIIHTWTGRIERAVRKMEGPQGSVTAELISDKAWLMYMLAYPAPFSPLWLQLPKSDIRSGSAVSVMKEYLARNLTRIMYQDKGFILGGIGAATKWNFLDRTSDWPYLQDWMWPVTLVPGRRADDNSPFIVLNARMISMVDLFQEVAKDYNLYVKTQFHVQGRDEAPSNLPLTRSGVWIDVIDKDKARSRGEKPGFFQQFTSEISIFIRGLFGKFDSPQTYSSEVPEDMKDWFGRDDSDPWVIFRYSREHWSNIEIASYSPTVTNSVAGGKSQEVINRGIELIANTAIKLLAGGIGLILPDIISGELDDIIMAYRLAEDDSMRDELGPFTFFEEYVGQGMTGYGIESTQALRHARGLSMGYRTATFTADAASFPPFLPFEEFDILDPVGFEDPDEDSIQMERIKLITVSGSRSDGISFEIRLGEAERPEDPTAIQQRRMEMFRSALISLTNSD